MIPRHRIALVSAPFLALLLAACSSASATPSSPNPGKSGNGRGGGGGVIGLVAAVNGTVVQVQNAGSSQVAIDLLGTTKITSRSAGTKSDVAVGDCVTATGEPDTAGNGLTARDLAVSPASGGSCTDGRRGGGNGNDNGGRSGSPRASRSPRPDKSGKPNGGNNRQAMIAGTVSAVSGNTITVTGAIRLPGSQGGTDTATKTLTITLAGTTKIQKDATATNDAIKPGLCLAATGANNNGTVQAKTVTIFPATGGACTAGNGNGGQRNGNGG